MTCYNYNKWIYQWPCACPKSYLVGGIPTPLKNMKANYGYILFPIYGKIKHVPVTTNQIVFYHIRSWSMMTHTMVFLWFSNGFPMVSLWFPIIHWCLAAPPQPCPIFSDLFGGAPGKGLAKPAFETCCGDFSWIING